MDILNFFLKFIKNSGFDIPDQFGYTPLHYAISMGNKDAMIALVKAGASLEIANIYGETPMTLALKRDDLDMAIYLTFCGSTWSDSTDTSSVDPPRKRKHGSIVS